MTHARYSILFAALLVCLAGCASAPISTSLPAVAANPDRFRNEYIAITALVVDNPPPQGDDYRTWSFTVGGAGDYRIIASEEGFNPSTIDKAYNLVEEARKAGEPVTITGRLRVGPYRELEAGMEIELVSVLYRDAEINTDKGPFVRGYYYYPHYYHGPVYLHFGYHYYGGHRRHHRHHRH